MKKQLLIPALLSLATPLFATNTIPLYNATRCGCTLNKSIVRCNSTATPVSFYVGTIHNTYFTKTSTKTILHHSVNAPITKNDGQNAIAYNSDGHRDSFVTAALSEYPNPTAGLTMVWQYDQTGSVYAPIPSNCIEPNTCQYLNTKASCRPTLALRLHRQN